MPIPKELNDLLKELKTEKKIDGKTFSNYISDLFDSASAKEKVQIANKELITKRDEYEKSIKDMKKEMKTLSENAETVKKANEDLIKNQMTDEQKAALSKGLSPEMEAKYNGLAKQLSDLNENYKKAELDRREAIKKSSEREMLVAQANQVTRLTSALTGKEIKGKNLDLALSLLKNGNLARVERNDDGTFRDVIEFSDNGTQISTDINGITDFVAKEYPNLISASGKTGVGSGYQSSINNKSGEQGINSMNRTQLVNSATNMLEKVKK